MKNKVGLYSLYIILAADYLLMFLAAGLVIFVILAGLLLLFEDAPDFKFARFIISTDHNITSYRIIPTIINQINFSRVFIIIAGSIVTLILNITGGKLRDKIKELRIKVKSNVLKVKSNILKETKEKPGSEKSRRRSKSKLQKLLKVHSKIRKKLYQMNRKLTFLSIDLVGSTTMKVGEDPSVVECDFLEYKKYVAKKLSGNNCIKSTWTPDGVMCCFSEFVPAYKAARDVITELEIFNSKVKAIKSNFVVRCGINSGNIFFDEMLPLEDISDRVIDIAAHIQEKAKENTLYVTKHSIRPVNLVHDFLPVYERIDDCPIYVWGSKVPID